MKTIRWVLEGLMETMVGYLKTLALVMMALPATAFANQEVAATKPLFVSEFFANIAGTWYDRSLEQEGQGASFEISFEKQGNFVIDIVNETVIAFPGTASAEAMEHRYESIWQIEQKDGVDTGILLYQENTMEPGASLTAVVLESTPTRLIFEMRVESNPDPIKIAMQVGGESNNVLTLTSESVWDGVKQIEVTNLTRR